MLVSQHNPAMEDISAALTKSLARDGRGGMQAALSMGGNQIRNVQKGVAPTDAATVGQLEDGMRPQRYDATAVEGQTRIPLEGPLIDEQGQVFRPQVSFATLRLNGVDINQADFVFTPGDAPFIDQITPPLKAGTAITVYGFPIESALVAAGDGVPLHNYPGTTETEDPNRWDHSNVQLENAQADTTNPASPNFGKWIDIYPLKGEGKRHADEWDGDTPIATDRKSGDPIPVEFMAQDGDTLLDAWSQNGRYEKADFPTPHDKGLLPGNLISGSRIRVLPGARLRRPPRNITEVPDPTQQHIRPYILCGDPNATPATTNPDTGIDTQSDVYRYNEIIFLGSAACIGENHRWGYREHHNDISLNAASDFRVISRHLGTMSDGLYIGAGNIGGGLYNRHNKRGYIEVVADGRNQNNRNVVSIIDCVGLRGKVRGYNFTKSGGAGSDSYDPNSGVLAPGVVDVEPNAFTDDPHIDDIELDVYGEDCGSSAVSTLLIDNNVIPHPIGSMRFTGQAVRCKHGKHTLIGASDLKVPYNIHVRMNAIDCERPFEVLTGQGCTHEGGLNRGSTLAGLIGYAGGAAPQDFLRINERDEELGSDDSGAIHIRGWRGGGLRGGKMANAKGRGYHLLPSGEISNLIFEGYEFLNRPGVTQQMTIAWDVSQADGGANILPGTIVERDIIYNGIPSSFWAVKGSVVTSVPGVGLWPGGTEVTADPRLEPGSPRTMRTVKANTTGKPFFRIQDQIAGFAPDTLPTTSFAPTLTNMEVRAGRFTATAASARAVSAGGSGVFAIRGYTPFSGSQTVYVGVASVPNPTSLAQMVWGVWFGDTTGGVLGKAVVIANGESGGAQFTYKYGDVFRVTGTSDSSAFVFHTPAGGSEVQVATTGIPAGTYYPFILINIAGETILMDAW